ncbi:hypothetical protein ACMHYO_07195 [Allopusillimonas ginsengisoli]|uniref:hypothetical protein n=1 Tax=Allopusillimonas ginsengisoli TaxID=453575 RepID=UPI0039C29312
MLLIGFLFCGAKVAGKQMLGAALSITGVLIVLNHSEWRQLLALQFVIGDLCIIVATIA